MWRKRSEMIWWDIPKEMQKSGIAIANKGNRRKENRNVPEMFLNVSEVGHYNIFDFTAKLVKSVYFPSLVNNGCSKDLDSTCV